MHSFNFLFFNRSHSVCPFPTKDDIRWKWSLADLTNQSRQRSGLQAIINISLSNFFACSAWLWLIHLSKWGRIINYYGMEGKAINNLLCYNYLMENEIRERQIYLSGDGGWKLPFWIIKRTVGMISFLSRTDSSGSVLIYDFAFSNYRG